MIWLWYTLYIKKNWCDIKQIWIEYHDYIHVFILHLHNIYTVYDKYNHISGTLPNNADANLPGSSWLGERDTAHQFAGNAEISVTSQGLFHSSSIQLYCVSLTRPNHVFQHLFVLLQQPTAAVIAQNAKEHVLVVFEMRHTLDDIDVRMLRAWPWMVWKYKMYFQTIPTWQSRALCAKYCGPFQSSSLAPRQCGQANESWASQAETHCSCAILASHSQTCSTPDSAYSIPEPRQEPLWFRCLGPLHAAHWTGVSLCPWTRHWSSCSAHIPGI